MILQAVNLALRFDDWQLWRGLSFTIAQAELVHLRAANGRGKTSLLRGLMGLNHWLEGDVRWAVDMQAEEDFAAKVLFVGHKTPLASELSVLENLQLLQGLRGQVSSQQQLAATLQDIGLQGFADMPAKWLSAGQSRRLVLSQCDLPSLRFWCFDEPFVALDKMYVEWLVAKIQAFQLSGGAVLFTSHQEIPGLAARELYLD